MLLCSPWHSHLELRWSFPSVPTRPKHTCHKIRWRFPEAPRSFLHARYSLLSLTRPPARVGIDLRAAQHPPDATENLRSSWSIKPWGGEVGFQAIGAVSQSHSVPFAAGREKLIKIRLLPGRVEKKNSSRRELKPPACEGSKLYVFAPGTPRRGPSGCRGLAIYGGCSCACMRATKFASQGALPQPPDKSLPKTSRLVVCSC